MNECRFEPEGFPILCIDCEKPTGEMGTCDDKGICPVCRQKYLDADFTEAEVAVMVIGVVSDEWGYKPRNRVLHYDNGSGPVCHARGGPHPVTDQRNETNCKKCVRVLSQRTVNVTADRG